MLSSRGEGYDHYQSYRRSWRTIQITSAFNDSRGSVIELIVDPEEFFSEAVRKEVLRRFAATCKVADYKETKAVHFFAPRYF